MAKLYNVEVHHPEGYFFVPTDTDDGRSYENLTVQEAGDLICYNVVQSLESVGHVDLSLLNIVGVK